MYIRIKINYIAYELDLNELFKNELSSYIQ